MLTEDSLRLAVRAAGIDAPSRFAAETASTNADALALAEDGAPEWTVVATGHQTVGRGRRGRSWTSAPGKALLFSMILRPAISPDRVPVLSLLTADALAAACTEVVAVDVRCKWPNDLVVGDRKVAGILPEASVVGSEVRHVVMGIGVNVAMGESDFPEDVRATATSLAPEGPGPDQGVLLERFLAGFRAGYAAPARDEALDRYRRRCVTLGRPVRAVADHGEVIEGRAATVDGQGALVVETAGGTRTVSFGEVVHLR
ncbi:MAG TPA: biotin--[acetyl-CoA-carboxylase] ligase [Actinomycetota bacterium]|nr:biotin--[acetyl-CoA-carboxylase] ligase [Actinomycetota bacterium]